MSRMKWTLVTGAVMLTFVALAYASTSVAYGRISAVNLVTERSSGAQTRGLLLGGTLGAMASSNRGAGAIVGGVAGQQLGRRSGSRRTFEYTITHEGGSSTTMRTDEAGLRVGDCVAVERGRFNNLRLVSDDRCTSRHAAVAQEAMSEADACISAKEQLLAATTEGDFDMAERRMRLLCSDSD